MRAHTARYRLACIGMVIPHGCHCTLQVGREIDVGCQLYHSNVVRTLHALTVDSEPAEAGASPLTELSQQGAQVSEPQ